MLEFRSGLDDISDITQNSLYLRVVGVLSVVELFNNTEKRDIYCALCDCRDRSCKYLFPTRTRNLMAREGFPAFGQIYFAFPLAVIGLPMISEPYQLDWDAPTRYLDDLYPTGADS